MEKTLSIIKPDAVKRNLEGKIISILQEANFKILALKKTLFSKEFAKIFYQIHKEKSFFHNLCSFMSSTPVVCCVLEKENAIIDYRKIMGATDPKNADCGTIRNLYGLSIDENSVHGSDSSENANTEIKLVFSKTEIF